MEQRKDCDTCTYEAKLGIEKPCRDCWKGDQWEPKKPEPDNVNHPAHYEGNTSLECIDVMEIAFGADALYQAYEFHKKSFSETVKQSSKGRSKSTR